MMLECPECKGVPDGLCTVCMAPLTGLDALRRWLNYHEHKLRFIQIEPGSNSALFIVHMGITTKDDDSIGVKAQVDSFNTLFIMTATYAGE